MSRLLAAALAAALLTSAAPAAHATCMSAPVGAVVLTPEVHVDSGAGGGALVATHAFVPPGRRDKPALALRVKGKIIKAPPRVLAPGLALYELPPGAARGELVQGKVVVAKIDAVKAERDPLVAPAASAITVLPTRPAGLTPASGRGGNERRTTVVLSDKAPRGASALIMYDERGTPVTFATVSAGATGPVVIFEAWRCETHPPGHDGLYAGAKATLAWVDASGVVGPRSAPITLTAAKPAP